LQALSAIIVVAEDRPSPDRLDRRLASLAMCFMIHATTQAEAEFAWNEPETTRIHRALGIGGDTIGDGLSVGWLDFRLFAAQVQPRLRQIVDLTAILLSAFRWTEKP
jgi:hypothetical protein